MLAIISISWIRMGFQHRHPLFYVHRFTLWLVHRMLCFHEGHAPTEHSLAQLRYKKHNLFGRRHRRKIRQAVIKISRRAHETRSSTFRIHHQHGKKRFRTNASRGMVRFRDQHSSNEIFLAGNKNTKDQAPN